MKSIRLNIDESIRGHDCGGARTLAPTLQNCADSTLLHDLWDSLSSEIRFLHRFDDFSTPAVPKTQGDLIDYLQANNEFIEARNRRIARSLE